MERGLLFAAYTAAYNKEGRVRNIRLILDALLAVVGISLGLVGRDGDIVAVSALVWLVGRELPVFVAPGEFRRLAVQIQEQFDSSYPGLAWNEALNGSPVQEHKIRALAELDRLALPANYWVDTTGLPDRTGALLRQAQSAAWGQEGHKRYARVCLWTFVAAIAACVVVSWVADLSFEAAVLTVWGPAAPFAVGRVQEARRHQDQAKERARLTEIITRNLDAANTNPPTDATIQSLQARLYRCRLVGGRIPTWLYERHASADRKTIDRWLQDRASDLREPPV